MSPDTRPDPLRASDTIILKFPGNVSADQVRAFKDAWKRAGVEIEVLPTAGVTLTQPQPALTHGRHCPCGACRREDWTNPGLASCGMHGPSCPPVYAPLTQPQPGWAACPTGYVPEDHAAGLCKCLIHLEETTRG